MAFSKRAEVEVQFNWMFVLIAGGLILILFGVIVLKQKEAATANAERTTLRAVKSLIAGAAATAGTSNTVSLPKTTLSFECNAIRAGDGTRRTDFTSLTVFAPKSIQTPELIIDTKQWSIPYNAGTLTYITSPKIRYIVLGSSPIKKQFCDMFPKKLKTFLKGCDPDLITLPAEFSPSSEEQLRFIVFNQNLPTPLPQSIAQLENLDVTAIRVDSIAQTISFHIKQGQVWAPAFATRPYVELPTLYGAAYANSAGTIDQGPYYDCVMKNAFKRASLITLTQKQRAEMLQTQVPRCSALYAQASSHFDSIYNSLRSAIVIDPFPASIPIKVDSEALIALNRQLQQSSCPLLY